MVLMIPLYPDLDLGHTDLHIQGHLVQDLGHIPGQDLGHTAQDLGLHLFPAGLEVGVEVTVDIEDTEVEVEACHMRDVWQNARNVERKRGHKK